LQVSIVHTLVVMMDESAAGKKKKIKGTVKAPLRLGPSTGPDLEEEKVRNRVPASWGYF
jgi:hypothetical protein